MRGHTLVVFLLAIVPFAAAGGPLYVTGAGFDAPARGRAVTWRGGTLAYFVDQGALSPVVSSARAEELIASAFAPWNSVPTAAVRISRGGALAQDVSGANVLRGEGGLSVPDDVHPTAAHKPLAIVLDADGAVTEALIGSGASLQCNTHAVYGEHDSFSADGHFLHAYVVINGRCFAAEQQVTRLRYLLMRIFGRMLGLGWSQLNESVLTGRPLPGAEDYAGFPLMHPLGLRCAPECLPNPYALRADDVASLSRLYPVTAGNAAAFPDKQPHAADTARIHGSVRFVNGAPMQGVNVVARLVDPVTGRASRRVAFSSVSGFLFRGDGGNSVTGWSNGGHPRDRFGSSHGALAGYFDLAGLSIPAGAGTATYAITVEPVDPLYIDDLAVGPYAQGGPTPSGSVLTAFVEVRRGETFLRDIIMEGSATDMRDPLAGSSPWSPVELPRGGIWTGALAAIGEEDAFVFSGRAGRSFALELTALGDDRLPSNRKAELVAGVWAASEPADQPPLVAAAAFNSTRAGTTRLEGYIHADVPLRIVLADRRGDGRPDFRYVARLLFVESVSPQRLRSGGGESVVIQGVGFRRGIAVEFGNVQARVLRVSPQSIVVEAPPLSAGAWAVTVRDPATGLAAGIEAGSGVIYGAHPGDSIELLSGANPPLTAGAPAPNPIRVRVLDGASGRPLARAQVAFTTSAPNAVLAPCGRSSCVLVTDALGEAAVSVTPHSAGAFTVTAALPNGRSVAADLVVSSSTLDVAALEPLIFAAEGASFQRPLVARALSHGVPLPGRSVAFRVTEGRAVVTATAVSDAQGDAPSLLAVNAHSSTVAVVACVLPGESPCATFTIHAVPLAGAKLEFVSGANQVITAGAFAPLGVRVSHEGKPLAYAPVRFVETAVSGASLSRTGGPQRQSIKVLRGAERVIPTGTAGYASHVPSVPPAGALHVAVWAGEACLETVLQSLSPPP